MPLDLQAPVRLARPVRIDYRVGIAAIRDIATAIQSELFGNPRIEKMEVVGQGLARARPAGEIQRQVISANTAQSYLADQQVCDYHRDLDIGSDNAGLLRVAHHQPCAGGAHLQQIGVDGGEVYRQAQLSGQ